MTEQGWQAFLDAPDVDDWVVLHGGATAVFRVPSLVEAARLAEAVSQVPGLDGGGVLMTLADDHLAVRLTRDVWTLEPRHVGLAQAISSVARSHSVPADRARVQEVQVAIAAHPDSIDVGFWRAVLGYTGVAEDNGVDPLGHGSTVWMQELDKAKPLRHAMHVDVSVAREHVEALSRLLLPPAAASLTTPRHPRLGFLPTVPATRYASLPGLTGPPVQISGMVVNMQIIRRVIVFDASDIEAESAFWAGLLGGTVHRDEDWAQHRGRRRMGDGCATCPQPCGSGLANRPPATTDAHRPACRRPRSG